LQVSDSKLILSENSVKNLVLPTPFERPIASASYKGLEVEVKGKSSILELDNIAIYENH
jgi:hypothetical protein